LSYRRRHDTTGSLAIHPAFGGILIPTSNLPSPSSVSSVGMEVELQALLLFPRRNPELYRRSLLYRSEPASGTSS